MGLLPKYKVEQMKREKRNAKAAKKRKENVRSMIVRFLVVCEGERTEPNYFKALVKNRFSEVREEKIIGEGRSTCALVRKTREIKEQLEFKRQLAFDRVWVVFDKDDFNDFNEAILLAKNMGFQSAWTNEAFELWYLLHFIYLDTGISRKAYIEKLEAEFHKRKGFEKFVYQKNNPQNYRLMSEVGDEQFAKECAKKLRTIFEGDTDYKEHKPCTMVDKLVDELEHPELLLKYLSNP